MEFDLIDLWKEKYDLSLQLTFMRHSLFIEYRYDLIFPVKSITNRDKTKCSICIVYIEFMIVLQIYTEF